MRLEVKKYLFDIQQAAKLVLLFTAGLKPCSAESSDSLGHEAH